jgi:PIN domain nuclease of toxin-antitoxin system
MQFLLDTNALIWWLEDPNKLSSHARIAIENPINSVICSAISAVEIAIKLSTGKLSLEADWEAGAQASQFAFISFTHAHARHFLALPALHKDPFDRMLVAQALELKATLITADKKLADYGVQVLPTF